jgi:hypothetical protein
VADRGWRAAPREGIKKSKIGERESALEEICIPGIVGAFQTDPIAGDPWDGHPSTARAGVGNLGGFVGPYVVGWIKDGTGSFAAGLYFLAACALASAVLAFFGLRPAVVEERAPALEPAE